MIQNKCDNDITLKFDPRHSLARYPEGIEYALSLKLRKR